MTTQNIFDLVDTWALSGGPYTSIKMNATDNDSASASLLMDLQVSTVSKFKVSKGGIVTADRFLGTASSGVAEVSVSNSSGARQAGMFIGFGGVLPGFTLNNTGAISWDSSTAPTTGTPDTILTRRGIANLRLGQADAASGVQAQTLSVQSITGTNVSAAAYPFKITGAQGTGTGAGGSIIFQVAPAGGAGAAQNTPVDALTIGSDRVVTVAANGNTAQIAMADRGTILSMYTAAFGTQALTVHASGGVWINNDTGSLRLGTSQDLSLGRDAANTLALRNGTAAQLFRVYSTYNGTNDAYGAIGAAVNLDGTSGDANTLYIGSQKKGSPTALTKLAIQVDGTTRIDYNITNASQWWVTGALGSSNVITGNGVFSTADLRAAAAGSIYWNTRSQLTSPADGNIVISNLAINDFGRLQFGGTTSSFPALKRNGAGIDVVGADGTNVSFVRVPGVAVASLPSASTAGVGARSFVTDATATTYASTVAGGGGNKVPVFSDGANWLIG